MTESKHILGRSIGFSTSGFTYFLAVQADNMIVGRTMGALCWASIRAQPT